jgi:transposase-like protein
MRCIGCGSRAVSERTERTAQGYRRFRCRDCGKRFNERSASLLGGAVKHRTNRYLNNRLEQDRAAKVLPTEAWVQVSSIG